MNRSGDARRRAFSQTTDPRAYVSRPALEAVRAALARWRDEGTQGPSLAALIAPPGLGKTFLLRLFESELSGGPGDADGLYLPYAGLALPDLSAWVHGLLGRTPTALDPQDSDRSSVEALMALGGPGDGPFFLIVDDAQSMPLETARRFARTLPARGSALRMLLALNDDARAMRLRAALDDLAPLELVFRDPMNEAETRAYLRSRMHWAGADDATTDAFVSQAAARIHALSGGVPGTVHHLAAALLEAEDRPRGPQRSATSGSWHEGTEWMGQPIDEDG